MLPPLTYPLTPLPQGIPPGDAFTDQSDLYVKFRLGSCEWKSTDVHYLAKKGKGSFNFRIKFPLKLRHGGRVEGGGEGSSYLKIQGGSRAPGGGDICARRIKWG